MFKCYVCEKDFFSNNGEGEHIIPNALGGKLTDNTIMCIVCNTRFGESIDTALTKSLESIGTLLDIPRDRGENQPFLVREVGTGEFIYITPGGKPVLKAKPQLKPIHDENGDVVSMRVSGKDKRSVENGLRQLKNTPSKEYLQIDVNEEMKCATPAQRKIGETEINISLNDLCLRAIAKIATNFYMHKGGEREHLSSVIPYIKGDSVQPCASFYYPENNVFPNLLSEGKTIHFIIIRGVKKEKKMYALIQLYGVVQSAVLLNKDYQGHEFSHSYLLDIISREEIAYEPIDSVKTSEIEEAIQGKQNHSPVLLEKMNVLLENIKRKQLLDYLSKLNEKNFSEFFSKFLEGEIIPNEDYLKLYQKLVFNFTQTLG